MSGRERPRSAGRAITARRATVAAMPPRRSDVGQRLHRLNASEKRDVAVDVVGHREPLAQEPLRDLITPTFAQGGVAVESPSSFTTVCTETVDRYPSAEIG